MLATLSIPPAVLVGYGIVRLPRQTSGALGLEALVPLAFGRCSAPTAWLAAPTVEVFAC